MNIIISCKSTFARAFVVLTTCNMNKTNEIIAYEYLLRLHPRKETHVARKHEEIQLAQLHQGLTILQG